MSIRAVAIDDESAFLQSLPTLLSHAPTGVELVGTGRSAAEGVALIDEVEPDLVFLDIQLGDGTGFDVLRDVTYQGFQTIFVTAYDQYAIRAFRCSAVDYLLKPVISTDLRDAIARADRARQRTDLAVQVGVLMENLRDLTSERRKLVLRESDAMHVVRISEILWCSAEGSYTQFYLTDGRQILVSHHLKEYEATLEESGFFRVHRSHLVNVSKIVRYERHDGGVVHLEGGSVLPVSVRRKERLTSLLSRLG